MQFNEQFEQFEFLISMDEDYDFDFKFFFFTGGNY